MNRVVVPSLALLVVAACGEEPDFAAELLPPDDVSVTWEAAYNGTNDGLGALVPLDVMAYDGATGEPLGDVSIEVWVDDADHADANADGPGATPLPVDAVLVIDPDEAEADDLIAWDAAHDQFVAVDLDRSEAGTRADGVILHTDSGGIARLYLFVDAFDASVDRPDTFAPGSLAPGSFAPITVVVSMGDVEELFSVAAR
ncbi:MAG: hypothetical protein ABMB14_23220 [Myxococcota bacterium]